MKPVQDTNGKAPKRGFVAYLRRKQELHDQCVEGDRMLSWRDLAMNLFLQVPVGIILYYLIEGLGDRGLFPFEKSDPSGVFYTMILVVTIWNGSIVIFHYFGRHMPWENGAGRRIALMFPAIVIYTSLVIVLVNIFFQYLVWDNIQENTFWECITRDLVAGIVTSVLINMFFTAAHFFGKWKGALVEAESLKKENLQTQFNTLKNQLSPHFLFNSLNTLAALIPENSEQSVRFVEKLSRYYRYVLQNQYNDLVEFPTEMEFGRSFLYLLRMRFGENLHVEEDLPDDLNDRWIPPLTLQILLENAVKHNVISATRPLSIRISVSGDTLRISNPIQRRSSVPSSNGIGLQNIRNRYAILSEKKMVVRETSDEFIVELPLLRVEQERVSRFRLAGNFDPPS